MYSGPDASYWERRLSNEHTEVLCVDLEASTPSNALDETTFAFCFPCAPANVSKLYLEALHAEQQVLSGFKKMMVHQFFEQKITHTVCHH